MKVARSGGQEQGTLTGWPLAPFTAPSQSPVPVRRFVRTDKDSVDGEGHASWVNTG
jgi:hypothetical protein